MSRICDGCRDEINRWYDVKPSDLYGIRIGSIGQNNHQNVMSANKGRVEDYYALVKRQERMIRERCLRDHQEDAELQEDVRGYSSHHYGEGEV